MEGWSTKLRADYLQRFPLFQFQLNAVEAIQSSIDAPPDAGLLALPTGVGKTKVALWWALQNHVSKGGKVLWIAGQNKNTGFKISTETGKHVVIRMRRVRPKQIASVGYLSLDHLGSWKNSQ